MDFKQKTLNNGLIIIGEVNEYAESAAVGFFVKTGARDETARTREPPVSSTTCRTRDERGRSDVRDILRADLR